MHLHPASSSDRFRENPQFVDAFVNVSILAGSQTGWRNFCGFFK